MAHVAVAGGYSATGMLIPFNPLTVPPWGPLSDFTTFHELIGTLSD
jgi:hypothetical protein